MRYGLHGYSTLAFTNGGAPNANLFAKNTDNTWVNNLAASDFLMVLLA